MDMQRTYKRLQLVSNGKTQAREHRSDTMHNCSRLWDYIRCAHDSVRVGLFVLFERRDFNLFWDVIRLRAELKKHFVHEGVEQTVEIVACAW